MKKLSLLSLVALFALGTLALPAAAATTLYTENFNDGTVNGYNGAYDTFGKSGFGDPFWVSTDGKLDSGVSDDIKQEFMFLTGEKTWGNVAISTHMFVNNQGSGQSDLILRSVNENTYYALRYKTGNDKVQYQIDAGLPHPTGNPALQIYKDINGKYTLIAETDVPGIPNVANNGNFDDKSVGIKFVANGSRLEGWIQVPGTTDWVLYLVGFDSELQAGKAGVGHAGYYPLYDDLTVETAE